MTPTPTDPSRPAPWYLRPVAILELFLAGNLAFLAVDVYLAHAINLTIDTRSRIPVGQFANPWEWVPILFSLVAALLLGACFVIGGVIPAVANAQGWADQRPSIRGRLARLVGLLVGWASIAVGVCGLLFHLQSDFFDQLTLHSLVYTAPFVAPLAYTGLGLLLILNRTHPVGSDHARWVLLLAMGGSVGNFILSLADHAQNGFYHASEWSGVIAAALAVGFLGALVAFPLDRGLRRATWAVLGIQVVVGLAGFALHLAGNLQKPAASLWDRFVFGSPVFAPLLFADVAVLAAIGLWALEVALAREGQPATPQLATTA